MRYLVRRRNNTFSNRSQTEKKKNWLRRRGAHTNGLTREQGEVTW